MSTRTTLTLGRPLSHHRRTIRDNGVMMQYAALVQSQRNTRFWDNVLDKQGYNVFKLGGRQFIQRA